MLKLRSLFLLTAFFFAVSVTAVESDSGVVANVSLNLDIEHPPAPLPDNPDLARLLVETPPLGELGLDWPPRFSSPEPRQVFSIRGLGEGFTPLSFRLEPYQEWGMRIQAVGGEVQPFIDLGGFEGLSADGGSGLQLWAGADWHPSQSTTVGMSACYQRLPDIALDFGVIELEPSITMLFSVAIDF